MAGRIRESDIAAVRERNRIDEVVGEYVALRRAGGGALKGLCPFHDEKTPSFNVRPSHGTFHCFGCGEGG
ncbi:CHC2 zinc finger domain-containing protein, partial [Streptomyces griseoaurantiacus]